MNRSIRLAGWGLSLVVMASVPAGAAGPSAATLDSFKKNIQPILSKYCFGCHGPKKQKGKVRLDTLSPDLIKSTSAETWHDALNNLNLGEMPPDDKPQPTKAARLALTGWITGALKQAAEARRATGGKVVLRRLTRYEYNNTMRDLLGVDLDFAQNLPPEPRSKDGFKNNGQALGISPIQMEYYLQSARLALSKAIVSGPRPKVVKYSADKAQTIKQIASKKGAPTAKGGRVFPGEAFRAKSEQFPREGVVRVRVVAEAQIPEGAGIPRMRVTVGHKADTESPAMALGEADMKPIKGPQTFEFYGRIERFPLPGHNQKFPGIVIAVTNEYDMGVDLKALRKKITAAQKRAKALAKKAAAAAKKNKNAKNQKKKSTRKPKKTPAPVALPPLPAMSAILIKSVEFEGPISKTWPPETHTRILFKKPSGMVEPAYARAVIKRFMDRAYRRPSTSKELDSVYGFYKSIRPKTPTFIEAIREALAMVLISPEFLYLVEPAGVAKGPQPLTNHELASRLSYFLWSTMPDEALLKAADAGKLIQATNLEKQVQRMIADKRSQTFVENFTSQWLDLSGLERVAVNPEYYPDFRDSLKQHMRGETIAFVGEILRKDLSALELLDSKFVMINAPLARHYGIQGPRSMAFERVTVKPSDRRGGLLTQASILLINSTGEDSHPIRRGVWVRDRLLDDPPAPPPPDVPELKTEDPKFSSFSLKKQLELHRQKASCNDCHAQIDPWGIPFENYDAIGKWREQVNRVVPKKKSFVKSPVVATTVLPGGHKVANITDLKKYLKTDQHRRFSQALVRKLLSYSLGRSLEFSDGPQVETLLKEFEKNDHRLGALIVSIAKSKTFSSK